MVFWDGSPNGLTTVSAYCDLLAAIVSTLGHNRFVLIPAAIGGASQAAAIRDEFLARWPNNTLDWRPFIPNTGGVIDAGQFQGDGVHLTEAAMNAFVSTGLGPFLESKGWD